jgi:hypothetical protein
MTNQDFVDESTLACIEKAYTIELRPSLATVTAALRDPETGLSPENKCSFKAFVSR